ncbi:MAG: septal ring lytic transglycosylase RlpA family protein, partial [Bacteroidota bacterium]
GNPGPGGYGTFLQIKAQERGEASYYSDKYHLKNKTASGEYYDKTKFTAAHRTLPFGTMVRVTSLKNGKVVDVRVNDRGPFIATRIIDLSRAAAQQIDLIRDGVAQVKIEVIGSSASSGTGTVTIPGANRPSTSSRPRKNVDISGLPVVDLNGNPVNGENSPNLGEPRTESGIPQTGRPVPGKATAPTVDPDLAKYTPNLFRMLAFKEPAEGFGVQVGAYFNYYRLLEALDGLSAKGYQNTLVHNGVKDGKPIFRIIIGPYGARKDAESMRKRLKKARVDGLTIQIADLGTK